jgi:hypothetical protein
LTAPILGDCLTSKAIFQRKKIFYTFEIFALQAKPHYGYVFASVADPDDFCPDPDPIFQIG